MLLARKPYAKADARARLDPRERQAKHRPAVALADLEVVPLTVESQAEHAAFGGIVGDGRAAMCARLTGVTVTRFGLTRRDI